MVFGSGPWLRDREGNDVFDGFGDTTIVDRMSAERTFSGTPLDSLSGIGRGIDNVDDTLHNVGATTGPGMIADSGIDLLDDAETIGEQWRTEGYPTDPSGDNPQSQGFRYVLIALLIGLGLWLIRPFVDLGAELAD